MGRQMQGPGETTPAGQASATAPLVSVIMANHQGAAYLEAAVRSVLLQSHDRLELIVADDGSTDGSLEILDRLAAQDARIVVLCHDSPSGPAAARNRALSRARGCWLAICDSDDVMHPDRLSRLLRAAEALSADAVADDMIHFATEPLAAPQSILGEAATADPWQITAADMLRIPAKGQGGGQLGYLKPLMRRSALGVLRYDETLQIGEDQDLYLRFLLQGGTMWVLPEALYLYRRHPRSLSYRSSQAQVLAAIDAMEHLCGSLNADQLKDLNEVIADRRRILEGRLAFEALADDLKAVRLWAAARGLLQRPGLLRPLLVAVWAKLLRQIAPADAGRESRTIHLIAPGQPHPKAGEWRRVPDLGADHAHSALWAELCFIASRCALTLTYGDQAGLSAAWRVPAAQDIVARSDVQSDLPRPFFGDGGKNG
jgi:succinoglycan biosynthesis protein ExoO